MYILSLKTAWNVYVLIVEKNWLAELIKSFAINLIILHIPDNIIILGYVFTTPWQNKKINNKKEKILSKIFL
jgi:hypothetical protein